MSGGVRPALDKPDKCQQPLSLQRKLQLGESRALKPEWESRRVHFIAVKGEQRTARGKTHPEHRAAIQQFIPVHDGQQRLHALQRFQRIRNVLGNNHLMTRSDQGLRHALEKRSVGPYNKNRCHYSISTPSASA